MKPVSIVKFQRSPYYLLDRLGILDSLISRKKAAENLPLYILSYHRFSPYKEVIPSIPPRLSVKAFKQQIEYIRNNFEPVPLSLIAECIHKVKPFPKNCLTITIDDGYRDNYLYAYPILKNYKVPATIFLITSCIDGKQIPWDAKISFAISHTHLEEIYIEELGFFNLKGEKKRYMAAKTIIKKIKRITDERKNLLIEKLLRIAKVNIPPDLGKELMLSWKEIREMSEGGIEFGAHTLSHPILTNIPWEKATEEIEMSKREIEEKLGKRVVSFAYPSGIYDRKIAKLVRKAGFLCAVTTDMEEITPSSDPYQLGRVIGIDEDFTKFKVILSGLYYKINTLFGLIG